MDPALLMKVYLPIMAASVLMVVGLVGLNREIRARAKGEFDEEGAASIVKRLLPTFRGLGSLFPEITEKSRSGAYRNFWRGTEKTIAAAGSPLGLTPRDVYGMTIFGMIAGAGLGALMYLETGVMLLFIMLFGLGTAYPALWITGLASKRRNKIRRALPYALDLLTLVIEAGMDFTGAISRVMPKMGNTPLAAEFQRLLKELRLGKSRRDGLKDLGARCDVEELTSIVASLVQADEMGTSLGPILRIQATTLRTKRSQRAEEQAMKAPVKMLFPLVAFIFPTVFIIIFGPIVIKTVLGQE